MFIGGAKFVYRNLCTAPVLRQKIFKRRVIIVFGTEVIQVTIYIDSLFLVNFFMDSVILFCVQLFLKRCVRVYKILLGAAVSAGYGAFMFFRELSFLYGAAQLALVSAAVLILVFGRRRFLKTAAVFWTVTFIAGGGIYALMILTDFGRVTGAVLSGAALYMDINPFILLAGTAILYILQGGLRRSVIRSFSRERLLLDINIKYMGRQFEIRGLIDTGCCLTEPLSGDGVIIAEKRVFGSIPEPTHEIMAATATGSETMKLIFSDEVWGDNGKFSVRGKVPIVLCERRLSADGLYNAIVNPDAVTDMKDNHDIKMIGEVEIL